MIKRITIFFLPIILVLFFAISAFALIRPSETDRWKEDILTLLSLVKRVGDYSEVVDLIEVAPALKEDPEIRKAFITFAPPGAVPPEWAREKGIVPLVRIEVPEKIVTAETPEKVSRRESEQVSEEEQRMRETEKQKRKEERARAEEARRIAQEVAAQKKVREKEVAPPEIIKEEPKIEVPKEVAIIEGPPEKIVTAETTEKVSRWESEQVSREEQRIRPTPLPHGAKVIHSTDVVSGARAEMVEGKARVIITLSGERKYTVSERSRPPVIVIDIPHTINAVSPEMIVVNQGCVKTIEVTQYRSVPFDETQVIIRLSRFKEYEIKSQDNEIYVEFEE